MTSEFSDALASAQWDDVTDPATAKVRNESDNFLNAYWALRDKVAAYKSRATPTATDLKNQDEALNELQPQLDAMEAELRKRRGDHFDGDRPEMPAPFSAEKRSAPVQDTSDTVKNGEPLEIPGKLPRIAVGRLALKAAWKIELEMRRGATTKEVMACIQQWADKGAEPAVLIKSIKEKHSVVWLTGKANEKEYSTEACEKTLEAWRKSRQ